MSDFKLWIVFILQVGPVLIALAAFAVWLWLIFYLALTPSDSDLTPSEQQTVMSHIHNESE